MDLQLKGHTVVVTGGASGIGRAIAVGFASEGCHVAIWDRAADVAAQAAQIAAETGSAARGYVVDVVKRETIAAALQSTLADLGPVDHLVHCAAIGSGKFGFPFTNLTPDDWPRVIEINIQGLTNIAHAIAPHMIERRTGTIVSLASVAGQIGSQTDPPYSAAKAANINFAQCLAKDLAPHNIRVNTVCPGMVRTPLNQGVWKAWHDQQPPEKRRSYEEWAGEKIRAVTPLGRWQEPSDIADMIVFLSSERARQVTGQTINVDGGFVMHW